MIKLIVPKAKIKGGKGHTFTVTRHDITNEYKFDDIQKIKYKADWSAYLAPGRPGLFLPLVYLKNGDRYFFSPSSYGKDYDDFIYKFRKHAGLDADSLARKDSRRWITNLISVIVVWGALIAIAWLLATLYR